jgi:hypothetical protein
MSHANVDPTDPGVFDPFNPPPSSATRSRPPTIRFRCELCGGQLVAHGARDVGSVERVHLAACPAVREEQR